MHAWAQVFLIGRFSDISIALSAVLARLAAGSLGGGVVGNGGHKVATEGK